MQVLEVLRDLFRHMEWADASVWKSVRSLTQDDDPALRAKLQHLHAVQRSFFSIWQQRAPDVADLFADRDFAALRQWAHDYHQEVRTFVEGVKAQDLDAGAVLPWSRQVLARFALPEIHPTTLGQTMFQVAMHSTYHRGQINTRIRELGVDPPLVDYIAWIWFGKPDAEW
ncbi:MAG TPA: DinB family protein [Thermoanaerobaculia bacterium]